MLKKKFSIQLKRILFVFFLSLITGNISISQNLKIDHVIAVVSNIDSATQKLTEKGFTVKEGRLHENNLINAHIKFPNNTSFEIISVVGEPKDKISKTYADYLKEGEGGVYISFSGIQTEAAERKLKKLNIKYKTIKGNNWTYIIFPEIPQFFLIDYHREFKDEDSILKHKNTSVRFQTVWAEVDEKAYKLFKGFDFKIIVGDSKGILFKTETGNIKIIKKKDPLKKPRITKVTFENKYQAISKKIIF